MKKMTKRFVAVVLMFMMALSLTVTAFAATHYPYNSGNMCDISSSSWYNIATADTSGNGIDHWVRIFNETRTVASLNREANCYVRFLGKNGDVLYNTTMPGNSSDLFWCGSDVYKIQVKTEAGKGNAYVIPVVYTD